MSIITSLWSICLFSPRRGASKAASSSANVNGSLFEEVDGCGSSATDGREVEGTEVNDADCVLGWNLV